MNESSVKTSMILALLLLACSVSADWSETFENEPFDLATWQWYSYPDSGSYTAARQVSGDGNGYLVMSETTSAGAGGSAFGIGFGSEEVFTDFRLGAVVNVTDEAPVNFQGIAGRASYVLIPGTGIVASAYVMHVNWEDGPANLRIDIEKVVQLQNIMRQNFDVVVPGYAHRKSYYAQLDVVGSDPTFVTGSLYEYKGGRLVARTETLVDTSGNDPWEDPDVQDEPFTSGPCGIFAQNENPDPAGYMVTFDDITAESSGPWAGAVYPEDGAENVSPAPTLKWTEAGFATSSQLWFGLKGAMSKITLPAGTTQYTPGILQANRSYEWKVDQTGPSGTIEGLTWSFTTHTSIMVEDFESYTNENLWKTWDPNLPGHPEPDPNGLNYIDTDTVNHGDKSMRIDYNNQYPPYIREFTRTFKTTQDWTVNESRALSIAFRGDNVNTATPLFVRLTDTSQNEATILISDTTAVQTERWNDWDIDIQEFTDQGVDVSAIVKIVIGIGDGVNSGQSPDDTDTVYIDNIRLYQARCFNSQGLNLTGDVNGDCRVDLQDFGIIADGWMNDGLSVLP